MQELVNRLTEKAGLSVEQASTAIDTIKDFVKEKFPMLSGAVDNMFASAPAVETATKTAAPKERILDKISDVIPGQTGEKVEGFVKNVADKAEDAFDSAKEKLSGLFDSDKK